MDDVVCFGVAREVVQLSQVTLSQVRNTSRLVPSHLLSSLTSHIGNTEDAGVADLLHATLVGFERTSTRDWAARLGCRAIWEVGLRVGPGLRRWLLLHGV